MEDPCAPESPEEVSSQGQSSTNGGTLPLLYWNLLPPGQGGFGERTEQVANLMLIKFCTFLVAFVPHGAQNVLQTQHFVLWLLFPRILHLRKIGILQKLPMDCYM